jgi:hypothetical protein
VENTRCRPPQFSTTAGALGANRQGGIEETFRARGGTGDALPGAAAVSGSRRVDARFAEDGAGELYLLTKSDGMIRQVMAVR